MVALDSLEEGVTEQMVNEIGGEVLFGSPQTIDLWTTRLRHQTAAVTWWRSETDGQLRAADIGNKDMIPLVVTRQSRAAPVSGTTKLGRGDEVAVLMLNERLSALEKQMTELGFQKRSEETSARGS